MQAEIKLTPVVVKGWAQTHLIVKGHLPTINTVELAPDGSTWQEISEAMQNGLRGWPSKKRQSLKKFLSIALKDHSLPLTHAKFEAWKLLHYNKYGEMPTSKSEQLAPCGVTWATVFGYASRSGQQRSTGIRGRKVKSIIPLMETSNTSIKTAEESNQSVPIVETPIVPAGPEKVIEQATKPIEPVHHQGQPAPLAETAPVVQTTRQSRCTPQVDEPTKESEILDFARMFAFEKGRIPVIASDDVAANGMKWEHMARIYTRGVESLDGLSTTKGKYITDLIQGDPLANPRYVTPTLAKKLALEHYHRCGFMPTTVSGPATDRVTWKHISQSMYAGRNGWPSDDKISLADFIAREFPVLPMRDPSLASPIALQEDYKAPISPVPARKRSQLLTPEILKSMLAEHFRTHGEYPKCNCRILAPDGSTWAAINTACSTGCRGWPKDQLQSLSTFIKNHCLNKSNENVADAVQFVPRPAAILEQDLTGRLIFPWKTKSPECESTPSVCNPFPAAQSNSSVVGNTSRSIPLEPCGQLVSKTEKDEAGGKRVQKLEMVTVANLTIWMDEFFIAHGRFPHNGSESIGPDGSTWRAYNAALRQGTRGWDGKPNTNLHEFAKDTFPERFQAQDESHLKFPVGFGLDMLLQWIRDSYHSTKGNFPTEYTLQPMPSGHRWSSVNVWCEKGFNGMPKLDFSGTGPMTLRRMTEHVKKRLRDEGIIPNEGPQQGTLPGM